MKWLVSLCASLTLADSAPDEAKLVRRLIGDSTLAPAQIGPSEEIDIGVTHWQAPVARHLLFHLGPDRILTVGRYREAFPDDLTADGRTSRFERMDWVRLSPEAFADVRTRLALFRPEMLAADRAIVLPNGCGFVFDAGAKVTIGYAAPGNRFGEYIRQGEGECGRASAHLLDEALREILASLPPTRAAAGFVW